MKNIVLYGDLRARFGRDQKFNVQTPAEAFHALSCVVDGFRDYMLENPQVEYRIFSGGKLVEDASATCADTIRFIPVVSGGIGMGGEAFYLNYRALGGKKSAHELWMSHSNQQWLGSSLVAVGYAASITNFYGGSVWGPVVAGIGQGILQEDWQAIANDLKRKPAPVEKGINDAPAFAFTGPHLTIGQGNPVPVLLGGPLRIGGAIISAGVSTEDWPTNGLGGKGHPTSSILHGVGGNGSTVPFVWAIKPMGVV